MTNRIVIIIGLLAFSYCQYRIYLIEMEFQRTIAGTVSQERAGS